jgi:molybdopterin-guanine dinucleotide biosynthesis protein A
MAPSIADVVDKRAGVVLAGGRSSRMGSSKAALEWHGSTLLRRTVSVVARAVDGPVVVVGASGQPLPTLPSGVEVLTDPREGLGPLQGIAVGLAAVADRADTAFVSSTDLPFLHPAFVRAVLGALTSAADVALPVAHGFQQPLAAAYRTALAPTVAALVAGARLRPAFLFQECRVLRLDEAALLDDPEVAALDPQLDSVVNVNEVQDYEAARSRKLPEVTVRSLGPLAGPQGTGHGIVRAATLAQAADLVALSLDRRVLVAVNGQLVDGDAEFALTRGDSVVFGPAGEG